jgi:four helix bundle protein
VHGQSLSKTIRRSGLTTMGGFADPFIDKEGFELSTRMAGLSTRSPKEETYSLTDQARRSSRSVTAHLAEGDRKRRYPSSFIAYVVDGDGENAEKQRWLDHAMACEHMTRSDLAPLAALSGEVGRPLADMVSYHANYGAVECEARPSNKRM